MGSTERPRRDLLVGGIARAGIGAALFALGCGGGGGGTNQSVIHFQLTTAQSVSGLESVRLTAGTQALSFPLTTLSPTATTLDFSVPSNVTGSIDVGAVARPAVGCMGYAGSDMTYIGASGAKVTVTILMQPLDICSSGTAGTMGTAGTSGSAGTGGSAGGAAGTGGAAGGAAGTGGSVGAAGTGRSAAGTGGQSGSSGRGGTGGTAGTGGAAGTSATAGTGGSVAGSGGRGGTGGGGAGTGGGAAGRGGSGGTGGAAGTGGSGATGGAPSCSVAAGGRPAAVAPPSLNKCTEYSHNDPGSVCSTTTNVNNPWINDVTVSPDGQYMVTAGSHRTSAPDANDAANDRVKVWRLVGNTPTQCASISITNPMWGPPYVSFSPNGQYLAVAWTKDYVYVYSVPGFTLYGTIDSSYGALYGVGWSPDSQTVFSIDYDGLGDGTLYADSPNGTPIAQSVLGVDPDVLAVSPVAGAGNVTTLAVGGYDTTAGVYTFNGTTFTGPTMLTTGPYASTWGARFSPSGNLLALGTDEGIVRFWSIPLTSTTPTGSAITNVSGGTITSLVFSPQGTHLAMGYDFQADIWNVSTRALVSRTPSAAVVTYADALAFSASGGALIMGEDNCGRVLVCAD